MLFDKVQGRRSFFSFIMQQQSKMEVQKILHATQSTEHMCCYIHKHIRVCVNKMVMIMRSASLHQQFDLLETQLGLCLSTKHLCYTPRVRLLSVTVGTTVSDFMSHILSISFPCDLTLARWFSTALIVTLFRQVGSGWMVQTHRDVRKRLL